MSVVSHKSFDNQHSLFIPTTRLDKMNENDLIPPGVVVIIIICIILHRLCQCLDSEDYRPSASNYPRNYGTGNTPATPPVNYLDNNSSNYSDNSAQNYSNDNGQNHPPNYVGNNHPDLPPTYQEATSTPNTVEYKV